MKGFRFLLFVIGIITTLVAPFPLFAAKVELTNGDVLHGEVVSMENGTLHLRNPVIGDCCINYCDVVDLRMDQLMTITLCDGTSMEGCISNGREQGQVTVIDKRTQAMCVVDLHSLCSIVSPCESQEPCQSMELCTEGWKRKISLAYSNLTGNSVSESMEIDFEAKKEFTLCDELHHRWEIESEYRYKEKEGEDFVHKGQFEVLYEEWLTRCLSWKASEEIRFDQGKNLQFRARTLLGAGYYLYHNDYSSIQLNAGFSLVDEFYDKKKDEHNIHAPIGFDICWNFYRCLVFEYEFEYSPDVFDHDDYRVEHDFEWTVPIDKVWSISVEYDIIYLSKPAKNKQHYDRTFDVKLSYSF